MSQATWTSPKQEEQQMMMQKRRENRTRLMGRRVDDGAEREVDEWDRKRVIRQWGEGERLEERRGEETERGKRERQEVKG